MRPANDSEAPREAARSGPDPGGRRREREMTAMGTAAARGRDPGRRRVLLEAAELVIRRDGLEASMAAIAAEAGVSKPILYRHFGSKHGLYRAVAERHLSRLAEIVAAAMSGPAGAGVGERSRAAIDTYLTSIAANVNLYRFLVDRAATEDAATHGQMSALVQRLGERVADIAVTEGLITDPLRAQILGYAVVGMVQAAGDWWLGHPQVPRAAVVEELTEIVTVLLVRDPRPRGAVAPVGASAAAPRSASSARATDQ